MRTGLVLFVLVVSMALSGCVPHWLRSPDVVEHAPERPLFCTRSLGTVDCWDDPAKLPGHPRGVADPPY